MTQEKYIKDARKTTLRWKVADMMISRQREAFATRQNANGKQ
jgi:hypothetical protein